MILFQVFAAIVSCFLIFSDIASAQKSQFQCDTPQILTIDLSDDQQLQIYKPKMAVRFGSLLHLTSSGDPSFFNFQVNTVAVFLNGNTSAPSVNETVNNPQRFSKVYFNILKGEAATVRMDFSNTYTCRIVLLNGQPERPQTNDRIANEIRRHAETCLEEKLCEDIDNMKNNILHIERLDKATDFTTSCPIRKPEFKECAPQNRTIAAVGILNLAADMAISETLRRHFSDSKGFITLPTINQQFTVLLTTYNVNLTNGTLRDITTLKRITDVSLFRRNMMLLVSYKFALDVADLNFNYTVKDNWWFSTAGQLTGHVNKSEVAIRIAADYNSYPCRLKLDLVEVKFVENIDPKVTGFAESLVTPFLQFVVPFLQSFLSSYLGTQIENYVNSKLASVECERFRPLDFEIPTSTLVPPRVVIQV